LVETFEVKADVGDVELEDVAELTVIYFRL
jgi:hypothetical protein